jgi:hypothetical protein
MRAEDRRRSESIVGDKELRVAESSKARLDVLIDRSNAKIGRFCSTCAEKSLWLGHSEQHQA